MGTIIDLGNIMELVERYEVDNGGTRTKDSKEGSLSLGRGECNMISCITRPIGHRTSIPMGQDRLGPELVVRGDIGLQKWNDDR